MTVSEDLRWRAVVLNYIYGIPTTNISRILGCGRSSIGTGFMKLANPSSVDRKKMGPRSRVTEEMKCFINDYVTLHPCFYIEELQLEMKEQFPNWIHNSIPTLCRILKHELKLTRKVLTKRAREAAPLEIQEYYNRLSPFYSYPDQLVFVDETSKDSRHAIRKYARSLKGTPAIVNLPSGRGKRLSVLACFTTEGFRGCHAIEGTFDRVSFHKGFTQSVLPILNPWPLPNSIVIIDNAKIHMYQELQELVHKAGALLFYLPLYCLHLNPIEYGFGQLKKWIQKHANIAFKFDPLRVLKVAIVKCIDRNALNIFKHCGYKYNLLLYLK